MILCLQLAVVRHCWRQIAKAAKELLHFRCSRFASTQWTCDDFASFCNVYELQILPPKVWICLWPTQLTILMSENILKQHIQTNPLDRTHCPPLCWATCESILLIDDCSCNAILLQHATVQKIQGFLGSWTRMQSTWPKPCCWDKTALRLKEKHIRIIIHEEACCD